MTKLLTRTNSNTAFTLPVKVIQFGEGNFLRAFADWIIDILNEKAGYNAGVVVVQPIEQGMVDLLKKQEGLYHLLMRGLSDGKVKTEKRLISCIQQAINPFEEVKAFFDLAPGEDLSLIISNTTEAGIEFDPDDLPGENELAKTFPGKLTQLLMKRFQFFNGASSAGVGIIPCELIDRNGDKLKQAVLQYAGIWKLPSGFSDWINESNYFANTLVDRIVTGYPREEINEITRDLGYQDQLVVSSEVFHLWIIEAPEEIQKLFPAHKFGLNVKYVKDQTPYRTRKVRILNGSHTAMVAVGMLAGLVTVKETVEHPIVGPFMKSLIFDEIIPTIDLPADELGDFANEVVERFMNPFIRHELQTISLNSISKFKVRVLPSILDFIELKNQAPERLCTAFASLIKLYKMGAKGLKSLSDDPKYLEFFKSLDEDPNTAKQVHIVLSNQQMWGQDLSQIDLLKEAVTSAFNTIELNSIDQTIETIQQS
jgi:tagaturonate reductase